MNTFLSLPFFLLSMCKPSFFICLHYIPLDSVMFFLSMFFLVYFLISSTKFNFVESSEKTFYFLGFSVVFFSLIFCFFSSSSLLFLFWLEMCVFFMIFLIFGYSKEVDKVSSTLFMFFLNILGSLPFMGFCYFYSSNLENLHWSLFFMDSSFSLMALLFMSLILILKLPILIAHFWLTKAHVAASGPLSMILASLMLKLGSMGMLKFNYFNLFSFFKISSLTLSVTLLSCFFFNFLMIFFFDLKFLVACSSILHMSLLIPMSLSGSISGCTSSLYMTVGHGFSSLILFFFLTLIYEFSMSRSSDMSKSQESQSKFYSKWIFIFSFINLGIPPFLSFMSELLLFSFLSSKSLIAGFLFSLIMLVSLFFTILLVLKILFGKKNDFNESMEIHYFSAYLKFCSIILFLLPIWIF